MARALYARRTPKELAESRQVIDYEGVVSDFSRLLGVVEQDLDRVPKADRPAGWRSRPVNVALSFGFVDGEEQVPAVEGSVNATLDAVCQRCLEVFSLPITADLKYVFAARGEVYPEYDSWELAERALRPIDLIEEAFIMALPMSAAHVPIDRCGALAERIGTGEQPSLQTTRPFAALKGLMEDPD